MDTGYDVDSENVKKQALLNLIEGVPLQTLMIAYVYAKNYMEYGEDVTKTWSTATEQSSALEKAYRKGYYDALQRQTEIEVDATNKDIFKAIFGYEPATDSVVCNKGDWCGASEPCNYCTSNSNNIGREEDWWKAPYKVESEVKE